MRIVATITSPARARKSGCNKQINREAKEHDGNRAAASGNQSRLNHDSLNEGRLCTGAINADVFKNGDD